MILIYDTFLLSFMFVAIDAVFFSNIEEMPDPENNRKQRQRWNRNAIYNDQTAESRHVTSAQTLVLVRESLKV